VIIVDLRGGRIQVKLVIAVVQDQDANRLVDGLMEAGYRTTKLASTGGFLKQGNTTLLIGVKETDVQTVVDVIKETCRARKQVISPPVTAERSVNTFPLHPVEIPVGGATVFVLNIEAFEKV